MTPTNPTPTQQGETLPDRIWMRAEVLASAELREHFVKLNNDDIEYVRAAVAGDARSCGFCGKTEHEVPTLISATVGYICNECVAICAEIIERDAATSSPTPTGPWIDKLVGTFDDSPVYAEVIANEKRARQWMEEGRCVSCGALPSAAPTDNDAALTRAALAFADGQEMSQQELETLKVRLANALRAAQVEVNETKA